MAGSQSILLILICSIVSSVVLFILVKSVYEAVDIRSFLVAAVLMTVVNGVTLLDLHPVLEWAIIAVADFFILKKTIDCTVYFGVVAVGVWIGVHILFFEYLSYPIASFLSPGGGGGS